MWQTDGVPNHRSSFASLHKRFLRALYHITYPSATAGHGGTTTQRKLRSKRNVTQSTEISKVDSCSFRRIGEFAECGAALLNTALWRWGLWRVFRHECASFLNSYFTGTDAWMILNLLKGRISAFDTVDLSDPRHAWSLFFFFFSALGRSLPALLNRWH